MTSSYFINLLRCLILFAPLLFCNGCKEKTIRETAATADSSFYSQQNYSNIILNAHHVDSILICEKTKPELQEVIKAFYLRRNYQTAWYSNGKLTESAINFIHRINEYNTAFNDSSLTNHISFKNFNLLINDSVGKNKPIAAIDVQLTILFFIYASKEYYGIDEAVYDLEWFIPRKKKNYELLLDKISNVNHDFEKYEPVNSYYKTLKKALLYYRKIEKSGGLPMVSEAYSNLSATDSVKYYQTIIEYFKITQDWPLANDSISNIAFINALNSFQQRMGISLSKQLNQVTIAAMNVPIKERIFQMMINLERLRWVPELLPNNYLLVNIPEYKLHVFEHASHLFSMKVVVGKSATATTIFNENLTTIVFSPYWNVPQSIIVKELLPKLKKDPYYLNKKNMEVVKNNKVINSYSINWNNYTKVVPFVIREKPGQWNSLGLIKFLFPNNYDIYMHDTPTKSSFEKEARAFSHGCIRLAEPLKLASYLLKNDKNITEAKMLKWMNAGVEKYVSVKPPMPVYIVYFTSWVNHKGKVNFRNDIYGLDKKLSNEIFALHNN
jgi:murein L,D-transpeptidase YcbB/YkuD